MKKVYIFVNYGIDGAASYFLFQKIYSQTNIKIFHKTTTENRLKEDFLSFLLNNDITDYEKIYILDLNTKNIVPYIDYNNVVVINHNKNQFLEHEQYKNLKTVQREKTSCTKLIYTLFKFKDNITKDEKKLVVLADNYKEYKSVTQTSIDLSNVYWSLESDKTYNFYKLFKNGFTGFSEQHRAFNDKTNNDVKSIVNNKRNFFVGNIKIGNEEYKIISCFCGFGINEVLYKAMTQYDFDIGIAVNIKNKHIYFRKKSDCGVDLQKLAEKLANGWGTESYATGIINETYLNFTKLLKPYE